MLRTMLTHARKHASLIPLFVFVGIGGAGSLLYALRVALKSPEVSWDKKNNPNPWNQYGPNRQYKFYNESVDYKKLKKEGPDYFCWELTFRFSARFSLRFDRWLR